MRRLSLAVTLATAFACAGPTEPSHRLTVTTTVSRPTFRAGDTVTVTVTVFNIGIDSTSINPDWCALDPFVVTTKDGIEVGPAGLPGACSAILRSRTLAPNESFSLSRTWAGTATSADPQTPKLLSAGDYLVSARQFGTSQESISVAIHVTN